MAKGEVGKRGGGVGGEGGAAEEDVGECSSLKEANCLLWIKFLQKSHFNEMQFIIKAGIESVGECSSHKGANCLLWIKFLHLIRVDALSVGANLVTCHFLSEPNELIC